MQERAVNLMLNNIQDISFPRKPNNPSLSTLEKAVSARIVFENLYFPLLKQAPSRERRRVAMEKDMNMQLSESQKEKLCSGWRQNETDYLRKVDVSAFSMDIFFCLFVILAKLSAFGVVSLVKEQPTGQLYAMKQV